MRQRSSYSKPFKAQVVQECLKPGASVSSVAINHGINTNVIRKRIANTRSHDRRCVIQPVDCIQYLPYPICNGHVPLKL